MIRISKKTTARPAASLAVDLRTPSGRVLPF